MFSRSSSSIFDNIAAPAPRYLMRLALIAQLVEQLPPKIRRFLEIGPGMGDISLFLADHFPEASGDLVDFSDESIRILRERIAHIGRLSVRHSDITHWQQTAEYDLVIACEVFEHIENDNAAFQSVSRLLRPGGYFLFSVPAFQKKWQAGDEYAGHYRRYERNELASKFALHNFQINVMWCYGFPVTQILYPLREAYYRFRLRRNTLNKQDATKISGVDRALATKLRCIPIVTLMKPFFALQNFSKDTDHGDGFLVLARKQS